MPRPKYRWETAHDWLEHHLEDVSHNELFNIASDLAHRLDADTIQDIFQTEMDEDGYFKPLKEPMTKLCSVTGCTNVSLTEGRCGAHLKQKQKESKP